MMVRLTQKNFDDLIKTLNHRMTKVEVSVKWMKWILGYVAIIITGMFVKVVIL